MARVCEICGKHTRTGMKIARRGIPKAKGGVGLNTTGRNKRTFKPNIQKLRVVVNGHTRRMKICTRCLSKGPIQRPGQTLKPQPEPTAVEAAPIETETVDSAAF